MLYLHDDFDILEASQRLSTISKVLLELALRHGKRPKAETLKEGARALADSGASIDDVEFVSGLFADLGRERLDPKTRDDLLYAIQLFSGADYRLRALMKREVSSPSSEMRARYNQLTELLESTVTARDVNARIRRQDRIIDTLVKRPGFYVAELYKFLRKVGATRMTYQTIWADIEFMQRKSRLLTIGGPQGSPRYCFPDPSTIENRGVFYNRPFGFEATIEEDVTERFEQTGVLFDIFRTNSQVRPVLLLVRIGVGGPELIGARIKAFGTLTPFGSITNAHGLVRSESIEPVDVVTPFNIVRLRGEKEEPIWHESAAFVGHSLYSDPITGAIKYSSVADAN